jgi:hypothetical protein
MVGASERYKRATATILEGAAVSLTSASVGPATCAYRLVPPCGPRGASTTGVCRYRGAFLFRLLGERLQHVRTTPETRPYLLCLPQGTGLLVLALTLVAQVIAMSAQKSAQKILSWPVQLRHPKAAPSSWAHELEPLSTEVARGPLQRYRFFNDLLLGVLPAAVAVGEDYLVSVDDATYGAGLSAKSRPGGAKLGSRP